MMARVAVSILLFVFLPLNLPNPVAAQAEAPAGEGADGAGSRPVSKLGLGDAVPDFRVADLDGRPLKLSELRKDRRQTRDGVVVLMFWCSFCHSCRHVEGDLDKLARDYRGRVGVFALDASANDTAEAARDAAKECGLSAPVLLDPAGHTADLFGTERTTTTVIIDAGGVLRYRGQFGHGKDRYAEDALKAVLEGREVPVAETPHRG